MMQRLDRLSKSDQLDGLLNRRGFKDCLALCRKDSILPLSSAI